MEKPPEQKTNELLNRRLFLRGLGAAAAAGIVSMPDVSKADTRDWLPLYEAEVRHFEENSSVEELVANLEAKFRICIELGLTIATDEEQQRFRDAWEDFQSTLEEAVKIAEAYRGILRYSGNELSVDRVEMIESHLRILDEVIDTYSLDLNVGDDEARFRTMVEQVRAEILKERGG